MFYYHKTTGQFGISLQDVRRSLPALSIPAGTREVGNFVGYDDESAPAHDPLTHKATETTPALIDGVWRQQWLVTELSPGAKSDAVNAAQAAAWTRIADERDRRTVDGGVKVGEHWFHTTLAARTQYSIFDAKATRAGWPDTTVLHSAWKTMGSNPDGTRIYTPMTVGLVRQILDAGIAQEGATFDAAEAHLAAMMAAADPAAYDFSTGWPAIYGEP